MAIGAAPALETSLGSLEISMTLPPAQSLLLPSSLASLEASLTWLPVQLLLLQI